MVKHVKVYMQYFGYGEQDVIYCELCHRGGRIDKGGFDIHHIYGRGKDRDVIDNLICLCRECHIKAHSKIHKDVIAAVHKIYLSEKK